ncbi:MAG TPA: hypothetical protein VIG76_06205 [Amnibacterium sp.]|uniref:hypothetical protein n=1 Tax=Amnibacterium sp. TaxID=1872496 RepID=UPI002F9553A6
MVYAFTQDVPLDEERYRKVIAELGPDPVDGCLLHLCVRREDGGLRYIDVWTSEADCARAFDERIHSAVDTAFGGRRPGQEPTVVPLEILDMSGSFVPAAAPA